MTSFVWPAQYFKNWKISYKKTPLNFRLLPKNKIWRLWVCIPLWSREAGGGRPSQGTFLRIPTGHPPTARALPLSYIFQGGPQFHLMVSVILEVTTGEERGAQRPPGPALPQTPALSLSPVRCLSLGLRVPVADLSLPIQMCWPRVSTADTSLPLRLFPLQAARIKKKD